MTASMDEIEQVGELFQKFDESQGHAALHALMDVFGWTGTVFGRGDVESWLNRDMTDEEWEQVRNHKLWYRFIPEGMVEQTWDNIGEVCGELGIESGEGN